MRVEDAIYDTVHEGGVERAAVRLKQSASTVNHKANPHQPHNFSARELIKLQAHFNDFRITHAMAAELGGVFVESADYSHLGDMELLDNFMRLVASLGTYSEEFRAAWADGRLTPSEFAQLKDTGYMLKQHLAEFEARLSDMVEDAGRSVRE